MLNKQNPEVKACGFRFYLDNCLVEEKTEALSLLKFLYGSRFGTIIRFVLRRRWWSRFYALYQNSRLSKRAIKPFVQKHAINMDDFERPVDKYTSFNDFFCRALKPGARSINHDRNVLVAPADAKLLVFPTISKKMTFFVKKLPFNLETFLRSASLADEYANASMMIFRLAPYDYHRYHFPVDGTVRNTYRINGLYDSVNPLAYGAGVQPLLENKRQVIELETEVFGTMLMVPVGAMCVGRIMDSFELNVAYDKGDEAGYFAFGGSTLVVLCKQPICFLEPFVKHSQAGFETAVKMGQAVAQRF